MIVLDFKQSQHLIHPQILAARVLHSLAQMWQRWSSFCSNFYMHTAERVMNGFSVCGKFDKKYMHAYMHAYMH